HPSGAGRPPRVLPAAQPVRSGAEVLPDHRCRAGRPRGPARLLGAPAARRDGRDHTHHDTGGHRMRTTDRIRLEHAVQRYDFWLDMRGVSMRRRRELRRELRTNLAEATADVGMTRAIFGIGSPKELAHAATENDPSRPRWGQGALAAALVFGVVVLACLYAATAFTQGVEASGVVGETVRGSVF